MRLHPPNNNSTELHRAQDKETILCNGTDLLNAHGRCIVVFDVFFNPKQVLFCLYLRVTHLKAFY